MLKFCLCFRLLEKFLAYILAFFTVNGTTQMHESVDLRKGNADFGVA